MMWLLLIFASLLCGVICQGEVENPCINDSAQKSCAACIATGPDCAWCTSESFEQENKVRCDKYENHFKGQCKVSDIQYPVDSVVKTEDQDVQDGDVPEETVQIQPQRVRVRIRPKKPLRIPIIFRQAENYPVDLYYLMDLSNSMEDDKEKLAELGNLIADRMKTITKNFRLGFGSFVDKVVTPYVSIVPSKLRSPCDTIDGKPCEAPYGFKNQLKLDSETRKFANRVRQASVSGNLDSPEGGFDAIMQAVVCEEEIGWRDISRRMLVFSTDAGFHYAGDGKLGGIVTPNDGQCHMDNGLYTESSNLDYPSVSQLANKIKEKAVNVIFAVTGDQVPIYDQLSRVFDGIAGELANDSSNIVKLIQDNYEKITSKVTLRAQHSTDHNITVKFFSRCFGSEEEETSECEGIKIGQTVIFNVEISIDECPKEKENRKKEIVIKPVGFQEKLVLEINMLCQCDCERDLIPYGHERCNGTGKLVCGICDCPPDRYGRNCECKVDKETQKESIEKCINPNSTSEIECSGQGACECGRCICFNRPESTKKFSGEFCECDDYSCSSYNGQLCGGPSRGRCSCGQCICNPGFSKADCSCDERPHNCITNNATMEECSGHGKCVCGKCVCDENHVGLMCEKCPFCDGNLCEKYSECVKCMANKKAIDPIVCPYICPRDVRKVKDAVEKTGQELCQLKNAEDCWVYYSYEVDVNGDVILRIQEEPVCPEALNVLAIVGGVVGGIVAVGLLLLLIWKLFAFIHDTREFAKFEAERQNAKWDTGENPIYKQATSTFKNPTYGAH